MPLACAGPLLREREREGESSRGVTERACDLDRASSGVGERPRDGLRLSDMAMKVVTALLRSIERVLGMSMYSRTDAGRREAW